MTGKKKEDRTIKGCCCKQTNCLKKYCRCFELGRRCDAKCSCRNCRNLTEQQLAEIEARAEENGQYVAQALHGNDINKTAPLAEATSLHAKQLMNLPRFPLPPVLKGCRCKRSNCMKNYCVCFEAQKICNNDCSCVACKNHDPEFHQIPRPSKLMHEKKLKAKLERAANMKKAQKLQQAADEQQQPVDAVTMLSQPVNSTELADALQKLLDPTNVKIAASETSTVTATTQQEKTKLIDQAVAKNMGMTAAKKRKIEEAASEDTADLKSVITTEILDSSIARMVTSALLLEQHNCSAVQIERAVLNAFGKSLQIIANSINEK